MKHQPPYEILADHLETAITENPSDTFDDHIRVQSVCNEIDHFFKQNKFSQLEKIKAHLEERLS